MPVYKRIIVLGVVGLAVAGVYDAIVNLLVASECTVTGNCTLNDIAEPPSDLRPANEANDSVSDVLTCFVIATAPS